ncbi:hypothetical protein BH11PLA2_BH11PLA2_17150 [soil metagenome]
MLSVVPRLKLTRPRGHFDTGVEAQVRGGTIALAIASLVYILRFAVNAPVVDEWDLTHVVLSGMTLSEWTFTRLNEHLFIPANAAFYILHTLTGLDFRAGMIANLIVLTIASLLMQNAAKTLRSRASLADLVIPAALLNYGHAYNTLMSFQLAFGFFVLSLAMLLNVVAGAVPGQERRTATRAGLVLLFVMLNGGMGIAFVPVVGVWILVLCWNAGIHHEDTKERRQHEEAKSIQLSPSRFPSCLRAFVVNSVLPLALLGIAVAYTAFALFALPKVSAAPTEPLSLGRLTWCVLQYLGIGTGLWYDGPHWPRNGILVAVGYATMTVLLGFATLKRRDGGRTAGLLALLLGHFAVALGIAVSRGGCLAERYVTISAIGLVIAWLGIVNLKWRGEMVLGIVATLFLIVMNIAPGFDYGHRHRNLYRSFDKDMAAGLPIGFLRDKYQVLLRVGDNLEPALERLRANHIRQFSNAVPTPSMTATPVTNAAFDVPLSDPSSAVLGLSVTFELKQSLPWSEMQLRWQSANGPQVATVYPPRTPGRHTVRIWVNDVPQCAVLVEVQRPQALMVLSASWLTKQ